MKIIKCENFEIKVDDDVYEWASKQNFRIEKSRQTYYAKQGGRRLHRLIMNVSDRNLFVDHINGNGLDNRRCNLRICTHKENNYNRKKKANTSSKYKGVYWKEQRKAYEAHIKYKGKVYYLGLFKNENEAGEAYNKAAKEFFGEFASLNVISN